MKVQASRELLAPREDVWSFLAEPYHLADWWPGIAGIQPDRRGMAPGARWQVVGDNPSLFRRPNTKETLLVTAVEPLRHLAFRLTAERLSADVTLEARGPSRTVAVLAVEGPALIGPRRSLARRALNRLYSLCQTAAEL